MSQDNASNRQDRGRMSMRPSFRNTGAARPNLAQTAKVYRAADIVREKAERHYEKHRETWVARQYGRLLLKSSPILSLNPPGMATDPKAALMQRARNDVARLHAKRLQTIENARKAILLGGGMRPTRKVDWSGQSAAANRPLQEAKAMERPSTRPSSRAETKAAVAPDRASRRDHDLGR